MNHPAVFAMNGKGMASIRIQSIQREPYSLPRHSRKAATTMIAMKMVPRPTMTW